MGEEMNHYEMLGVSRAATADEIRLAFREKAKSAHPDAGGDAATFRALCHAREVLSDPARRSVYDASLAVPSGFEDAFRAVEAVMGPIDSEAAGQIVEDLFGQMLSRAKREMLGRVRDELRKRGVK